MEHTRTYECMCLLDNREVRKGWQPLKDAVAAIFAKHGAEVLSSRRWDERRLSYPVRGQLRGTYLLVYFKTGTDSLTAIRRDLQFAEPVMRFLTMQCDEVPESAFEPEAEFDVNAIPDEGTVAEPEPAKEKRAEDEEKPDGGDDEGEKAESDKAEGENAEGENADGEEADGAKADGEDAEGEPAAATETKTDTEA